MDFETWWEKIEDRFLYGREAAEAAWQAAQQAERDRTTAIMLKHLAQWNVPWSESVDKAVKEINELEP